MQYCDSRGSRINRDTRILLLILLILYSRDGLGWFLTYERAGIIHLWVAI